ncbi:MAG: hypothetical protein D6691_04045 [Candidatus Hydrogenedentota bacterium]|uniref:Uncharacterized protein n=1 Tax=Sumerlaea chitinivorans TaxID=2250252 RepID=A0A2Z4Y6V2_SUMC1|nr:hypothetical protein BRCON_2134 [Candidatus Sumerlaea chitinivorans]RMH28885.1 MAG: hypothetical protein D6691_04045 [Candidatus Hydrogenedentota bacterium]
MKFYFRLLSVVAIVALVLWYLHENAPAPSSSGPGAESGAVATSVPESPTPLPTVAVSPSVPPSAMTPIPTPYQVDSARPVIQMCAQRAGVTLVHFSREGGWLRVVVQGRSHNSVVSDFLDELRRAGMRDLDLKQQTYRQFVDRQGQLVFEGGYRVRF